MNLQKAQLEAFKESEKRQHDLILKFLENQKESEEREQNRDRQFFLEIGKMFANGENNKNDCT